MAGANGVEGRRAERRILLGIGGVLAYAALSHALMLHAADRPWAAAALLAPGVLAGAGWALAQGRRGLLLGCTLVLAGLVAWSLAGSQASVQHLYLAQHAGIHVALGAVFGASLRIGATPMITGFARRVHRAGLSPAMAAYTRRLTAVWAGYFFAMAALSVALFAAAPWSAWSLFANLLTPASVALLFLGEHLLRYRLHPEFERAHWRDALRASWRPAAGEDGR
ncbi:hypothetical protein [Piscinibacter sakaiensis]|uniref:Transmembrane protein n=1 Tax=Piscinibacter sakaiensis TaxID=1547922 RepID=A0A0K8P3S1_PISS1|nr:hypothetical protein [Piscinibacter sakaiensis]GAP37293.1 hypothetical protein ISF6_3148 [Piscinibacter sakaiensis]